MFFFIDPLGLLLGVAFLGILWLFFIPAKSLEIIRFSSLSLTVLLFLLSLFLWISSKDFASFFQHLIFFRTIPLFGVDGLSLTFILLTTFIFLCSSLLLWNVRIHVKLLSLFLALLELLLLLVFTTVDIFLFYIFFELSLLPMILIIFFWGSRSRKVKAGFYFFLYTLFGSLFMLVGIIEIYYEFGTTNLIILSCVLPTYIKQIHLWLLFFFSFAIKLPMFPFHIWLPEAHVEAPTIGSVLLAGLLLKLGAYGFLRILLPLFPWATLFYQPFVLLLAIMGVIFSSLSLLRQIDFKKIIAYSSVAHMNFAVLGLFSNTVLGLQGSIFLFVSHGFSSAALFVLVGLLYEKFHTRLIFYYGGLVQIMPFYACFFFLLTLANFGFPGTSNFIGEFLVFLGIIEKSFFLFLCGGVSMLLSVVYSILLFNRLMFGELKTYNLLFPFNSDLSAREFSLLSLFVFTIIFFGVYPTPIFELINWPALLIFSGVERIFF